MITTTVLSDPLARFILSVRVNAGTLGPARIGMVKYSVFMQAKKIGNVTEQWVKDKFTEILSGDPDE